MPAFGALASRIEERFGAALIAARIAFQFLPFATHRAFTGRFILGEVTITFVASINRYVLILLIMRRTRNADPQSTINLWRIGARRTQRDRRSTLFRANLLRNLLLRKKHNSAGPSFLRDADSRS